MVVLTLEHATEATKGELRRYLYEIRSGIYVGTISGKVREKLWQKYIDGKENIIEWNTSNR